MSDDSGRFRHDEAALLESAAAVFEAAAPDRSRPLLYELSAEAVVMHADHTLALGPPFEPTAADSWRLPRVRLGSAAASPPAPLCVSLAAGGGVTHLVDLAAAGLVGVVGTGAARDELLAALAEQARSGAWAPPVRVLRGDAPEVPDGSGPLLVVARRLGDEALTDLVLRQAERPGLVVLSDSLHPAFGVILLAGEGGESRAFLPRAQLPPGGEPPRRGGRRREPVEVRVLGAIEVVGVDPTLGRHPRLTELIAYFAMHPGGSTSRTWTGALWPERRVPQQTVANRLSEARRFLGFAADDLPRLRRNGERHLLVEVTTDWAYFGELAAEGGGPESWHRALELVRGRPFGDLAEGQWTVLEGFVAEMEQAVAATALRLGAHALAGGDPDEAVFAARQALRAAPYDERLHRLLMRAADKAGNRAGVEGVLQQLALMLEIDGDPLGGVHPETAALYEQLRGRSRSLNAG